MVSSLSTNTHRTLHHLDTDESMVSPSIIFFVVHSNGLLSQLPIFVKDTNGSTPKSRYIMGRRNWCCVDYDQATHDLVYDIRVEKEKGCGVTVG